MGSQHLRVYGDLAARCEVVAVAEKNEQRWESYRKRIGVEFFSDYHDMLSKTKFDAVSIALPNDLHCSAAIDFLKKGEDVIV
jgi:predicted dehydrogenase